jgi:hypothetical protein
VLVFFVLVLRLLYWACEVQMPHLLWNRKFS